MGAARRRPAGQRGKNEGPWRAAIGRYGASPSEIPSRRATRLNGAEATLTTIAARSAPCRATHGRVRALSAQRARHASGAILVSCRGSQTSRCFCRGEGERERMMRCPVSMRRFPWPERAGTHGRGTRRDEGAPARAKGGRSGRGKRRAREDRRDGGTGSRHGRAAPCDHQSQRARPRAADSGTGCPRMPRTARSSASSRARRSSRRGTRRSASTTQANLDEGGMWPVAFALKELTAAEEARIGALVQKAVS